ncbi:hypothetical protein FHE66_11540 [Georgenia sp. 311]|uniref:hypothetical protein n=1 Tax=Georgenia sp. 311 TaxID=2585134 RepID=UPI001111B91F|nr:hypothetical protein [Georgenia sp. 311]TNC17290.1 hypothetical protein FHE66_11540 [Georgenia sp. 311]
MVWAPQAEGPPESVYVLDTARGTASVLPLGPYTGELTCGGPFLGWTEVRQTGGGEVRTVVVARWAD